MPCAFFLGRFNSHRHSTNLSNYSHKLRDIQLRRGGKRLSINLKRRHNARINAAGKIAEQHPSLPMTSELYPLALNELLDGPFQIRLLYDCTIPSLEFNSVNRHWVNAYKCNNPRYLASMITALNENHIAKPVIYT
jgi:hypothetical protein